MTWFVLQSLFFILGAFLLGFFVGWLTWGRESRPERLVVLHADGRPAVPATGVATSAVGARAPEARPDAEGGQVVEAEPVPFAPAPVAAPEPESHAAADGVEPKAERQKAEPEPDTQPVRSAEDVAAVGHEPRTDGQVVEPPGDESEADDLRVIEGIGPKVADALHAGGIRTYADLAASDQDTLRTVLRTAGLRFSPSLPSWPGQAELLAAGDKEGFAELAAKEAANRRSAGTV